MNSIEIIVQYRHGIISEAEATTKLDDLNVRGSFSDRHRNLPQLRHYIGYDYSNQIWIQIG